AKIQRVVWLLNDDLGFGGYKKIKNALVFEGKFNKIDMVEEPFEDLKTRQRELMRQWELNPNNIINLRRAIKK
ncbi:nucleoside deaminase, partial [Bacillus cereus]|nr:nucleoside deaminase [Bacillus cereus]